MRTLGNVLWHVPFLGFVSAFFVFIFGALLTILVIPAPIGLGLMQYAKFLLAPFSNEMISQADINAQQNPLWKVWSTVCIILYLPFGIFFAIGTAMQVCLYFVTIVGIPVALVLAKSLGTYLNPVNKI